MNFYKDILLVDLEMTGLDVARHEIIQIAAVLLDKETLKEKKSFVSFARPKAWQRRDKVSMEVNKISWESLKDAPDLKQVLQDFAKAFALKKTVLSYYGGPLDIDFLKAAFKRNNLSWQFDYHYFNLWPVFYVYMAERNLLKNKKKHAGFTLEDIAGHFGVTIEGARHDALFDCRLEAEILRAIHSQIHR